MREPELTLVGVSLGRSRPNQPAGQSLIPSIDFSLSLSRFPRQATARSLRRSQNLTAMESMQSQNTSVQRLQNVEKRIVRVLELAGGVMDELANPTGPRKDLLNNHCGEFMKLIKDIQVTLREEIKSACEYRPFEKSDYGARLANEICCKKLEYTLAQLDTMKQTIDEYHSTQG